MQGVFRFEEASTASQETGTVIGATGCGARFALCCQYSQPRHRSFEASCVVDATRRFCVKDSLEEAPQPDRYHRSAIRYSDLSNQSVLSLLLAMEPNLSGSLLLMTKAQGKYKLAFFFKKKCFNLP